MQGARSLSLSGVSWTPSTWPSHLTRWGTRVACEGGDCIRAALWASCPSRTPRRPCAHLPHSSSRPTEPPIPRAAPVRQHARTTRRRAPSGAPPTRRHSRAACTAPTASWCALVWDCNDVTAALTATSCSCSSSIHRCASLRHVRSRAPLDAWPWHLIHPAHCTGPLPCTLECVLSHTCTCPAGPLLLRGRAAGARDGAGRQRGARVGRA